MIADCSNSRAPKAHVIVPKAIAVQSGARRILSRPKRRSGVGLTLTTLLLLSACGGSFWSNGSKKIAVNGAARSSYTAHLTASSRRREAAYGTRYLKHSFHLGGQRRPQAIPPASIALALT